MFSYGFIQTRQHICGKSSIPPRDIWHLMSKREETSQREWSGVLCFLHQLLIVNTPTLAVLLANVISEQTLRPLFVCPNGWLALRANAVQKGLSSFLVTTQSMFVCIYRSAFSKTGYVQAETRWR